MPPSPSRSLRKPLSSPPMSRASRPPVEPTRLRVLIAGVEKGERPPVEAAVRRALAGRDPAEPWSVSLVRLGTVWSVTLSGPGERFRNVSITAEEHRLAEAIGEAIGNGSAKPARETGPSDSPTSTGVPVQECMVCERCQKAILVTYEGQPNEPTQAAPLACPHCWTLNQVEVGAWAAAGGDYRADKA